MADTKTTNYKIVKPDPDSFYSISTFNSNADIIDGIMKENADNIKLRGKPSVYESYKMLATGWSSESYSLESDYPKATYDIEIAASDQMNDAQIKAFNKAVIVGSATTNIVKALGTVPTIDLSIIIRKVAK